MANRLVVFFCRHHKFREVEISGVFDMDFFEEEGAVKFYDENHELKQTIPLNPYDKDDDFELWNAFNQLSAYIRLDRDFEELLAECIYGIENLKRLGYNLEMEALTWE